MKLLRRPVALMVNSDVNDSPNTVDIDNLILDSDLESINHDDLTWLLTTAINDGDYHLTRRILDIIDPSDNLSVYTLAGLVCLFTLYDEYRVAIRDVGRRFLQLINLDYGLNYCMSEPFIKHWSSIDYRDIKNPNVMAQLKGKVSNCNQVIELLRIQRHDGEVTTILDWCKNVIPASESIDNDNILYLINKLMDDHIASEVMSILLRLHEVGIIDIRDYRDDHRYIKFIVEQLERVVVTGRRVKNATNIARVE